MKPKIPKPPKKKGLDRPRHAEGVRGGHKNLIREALEEGQDLGEPISAPQDVVVEDEDGR